MERIRSTVSVKSCTVIRKKCSTLIFPITANVSVNDSRGANPTYTHNYGLIERDLMQASEVSRMPRDQALVLINGAQAYLDKKYPLDAHPRRESLEAASKRGTFDFKRYRARREGMLMGE